MKTLFSLKLWGSFLSKAFESVFPPFAILLLFAWKKRSEFLRGPALRFFLLFSLTLICLLFVLLFSGTPFEKRYFFTFAAVSLLLAAPGFYGIRELLLPFLNRWPFVKDNLTALLLLVLAGICLGKALNPSFEKIWMQEIAGYIKASNKKVYLITDSTDGRIAYYAGAEYVRLSSKNDDFSILKDGSGTESHELINGVLSVRGSGEIAGKWVALPGSEPGMVFLKENIRRIEEKGNKVYLLFFKDDIIKKAFLDDKVPFPLSLVKIYKDEKKRPIFLYELSH
ncbi:MAG: hypothetical protein A2X49_03790 [Lentisphaerae bacterium GWF2_52_8]|nr:MAG: hypothetical protein A2X49_03790 [Lentisphaerae bacterium GWF2_52_8]